VNRRPHLSSSGCRREALARFDPQGPLIWKIETKQSLRRRLSGSYWAAPHECETAMCDKCVEIDSKIEHYQRMASRIADEAMLDGIKELIERLKAQKAVLHTDE
jgi:hypothetical protein